MEPHAEAGALTRITRELRDRAELAAASLTAQSLATAEEIAARLPGGEDNPYPPDSTLGWAVAYAGLFALLQREGERANAGRRAKADDVLLAALSDTPAHVTITRDGQELRLGVHPKSIYALRWFEDVGRRIEWLLANRAKLIARDDPQWLSLIERSGEEVVDLHVRMAVVATTPGPQLPCGPEEVPKYPDWAHALSSVELVLIRNAFVEVNAVRLSLLRDIITHKSGKEFDLSWAQFFATRAEETHEDVTVLLRDRSLASQLAAAALANDTKARAHEAAKEGAHGRR